MHDETPIQSQASVVAKADDMALSPREYFNPSPPGEEVAPKEQSSQPPVGMRKLVKNLAMISATVAVLGFFAFKQFSNEQLSVVASTPHATPIAVSPAPIAPPPKSVSEQTSPLPPDPERSAVLSPDVAPAASMNISGREEPSDSDRSSVPMAQPKVVNPIASEKSKAHIDSILVAAIPGDMVRILNSVDQIQKLPLPQRGDRKAARLANDVALAAIQTGDFDTAVRQLRTAVAADPSDQEVINNLAYALIKAGRSEEALDASMLAVTLSPSRSSAWFNLGEALAILDQQSRAVSAYVIAYRFSKNPQRTKDTLAKQASEGSESSQLAARKSIEIIDAIR